MSLPTLYLDKKEPSEEWETFIAMGPEPYVFLQHHETQQTIRIPLRKIINRIGDEGVITPDLDQALFSLARTVSTLEDAIENIGKAQAALRKRRDKRKEEMGLRSDQFEE